MKPHKFIFYGLRHPKLLFLSFISCSNVESFKTMKETTGYIVEQIPDATNQSNKNTILPSLSNWNPFKWFCTPKEEDLKLEFQNEVPKAPTNITLHELHEKEENICPERDVEFEIEENKNHKHTHLSSTATTKRKEKCIFEENTEDIKQTEDLGKKKNYKVRREPFNRNPYDYTQNLKESTQILKIGEFDYASIEKSFIDKDGSILLLPRSSLSVTNTLEKLFIFKPKDDSKLIKHSPEISWNLDVKNFISSLGSSLEKNIEYHILYNQITPKGDEKITAPYRLPTVKELFYILINEAEIDSKTFFDKEICTSDTLFIGNYHMNISINFSQKEQKIVLSLLDCNRIAPANYTRIAVYKLGTNFSEPSLFYVCYTPVFCCNNMCVKPKYMCHCCYCLPYSTCCENSPDCCGNYVNFYIPNVLCCYMPAIEGCFVENYTAHD